MQDLRINCKYSSLNGVFEASEGCVTCPVNSRDLPRFFTPLFSAEGRVQKLAASGFWGRFGMDYFDSICSEGWNLAWMFFRSLMVTWV